MMNDEDTKRIAGGPGADPPDDALLCLCGDPTVRAI